MPVVPNYVVHRGTRFPAGPLNPLAAEVVEGWISAGVRSLPVPPGHALVALTNDPVTGEPVLLRCDTREEAEAVLEEHRFYELGTGAGPVYWFAMLPRTATLLRRTGKSGAA